MAPEAQARHWLITGVSSGLGRALAEAVLDRGGVVVGTLRDARQAAEFELLAPGRAFALILDATDAPEVIEERVAQAIGLAGHIDVLVNNAGYGLFGAVEEVSEDELRHQMETNFFGPLRLIRALLPHLRERGRGHVVNIGSIAGFRGLAGFGVYSASKFALAGLSEALVHELRPLGIGVTIVQPGSFRTNWMGKGLRRTERRVPGYSGLEAVDGRMRDADGAQPGDPARGAAAVIAAVEADTPPVHLPLGADAHQVFRGKLAEVGRDLDAWEQVILSTTYETPAVR